MNLLPPQLVNETINWLVLYLPALYASAASFFISFFMSMYDGKKILQTTTGSLVCGIFTLAVSGCLGFFGLPDNAVTFVGAAIGFMGVERIRNKVAGFIDSKTGRARDENR